MILIALGSNLSSQAGAPLATLHLAIETLPSLGIHVLATSSFYDTPAWPNPADPAFVNAICKVGTEMTPADCLARLHALERRFGRERITTYSPRTLDLDIIDWDGLVQAGPPALPHPRLESRGFVLIPLRDVAPEWCHPISQQSVDDLIAALPPQSRIATKLTPS